MLRIAEGTEKLLLNQQPSERAAVSYTQIFCFPLLYPLQQNGSPRLAVLQGTFHKKRGFCEKRNNIMLSVLQNTVRNKIYVEFILTLYGIL